MSVHSSSTILHLLDLVVSSIWSIFESKVVKKILFKEDNGGVIGAPAASFRKGK